MSEELILNSKQIAELEKFNTPTICNAIESFKIRPNTEGFMGPDIKCMIPYTKPIAGYAVTAKISAVSPPTDKQKKLTDPYYKILDQYKIPTIAVIEDLDQNPIGSFWGEVNSSIHMVFNCLGVITNGGVRDIKEAEAIGFRYFASNILVSHAYVHLVEINCPVEIGGLLVKPGDLLHADIHGVALIPHEISSTLAVACKEVMEAEAIVIKECQKRIGKGIKIDYLQKLRTQMYELRDKKRVEDLN